MRSAAATSLSQMRRVIVCGPSKSPIRFCGCKHSCAIKQGGFRATSLVMPIFELGDKWRSSLTQARGASAQCST
eukprot:8260540-Heterocapsa_arctica.AAC.1